MRLITRIAIILTLLISAGSCTQNDGMIGSWFGTWALDEILIDGVADADYTEGSTFFSFQSSVVRVCRMDSEVTLEDRYGTWESKDGYLTLDFSYHDDFEAPGTSRYASPEWIYLTEPVTRLQMEVKTSRRMTLRNGNYTYILRKTW